MLGTVHKRKLFNTRVTTKNSRSQRTGRVYPPRSTGGHVRERVEAVEDVSRMVAEQAMTRVRVRTEHISVGGPIPHSFPSLTRQASWIWTHHGKWQFRCSSYSPTRTGGGLCLSHEHLSDFDFGEVPRRVT